MSISFEAQGFKELEEALAQLARGTAKNVTRRAMKKALKPIENTANSLWPGSNDKAFITTSRVKRSQPRPPSDRATLNMFVGSAEPQAHLLEWGTGPRFHQSGKYVGAIGPTPMLGLAWDLHKAQMLDTLRDLLGAEIEKTFARLAAKGT